MAICTWCEQEMMSCGCRFDGDDSDDDPGDSIGHSDDIFVDGNGCLAESVRCGDHPVIVHYDDVPESDITTVNGIRCTTALRTVIDIAGELPLEHVANIVQDSLDRKLFTLDEARARLAKDDMRARPGAQVVRRLIDDTSA